ncbi:hypothetical protein OC842_007502 [Tilletia horrida]|uniref:Uncharacterized protein n=1 Tax=Tilletia horrida TaxID=155126 RepID=A0AAN6G3S7_9BASI|nr:hypothetical protein OC842_007502 [Tilletia horrida]
MDEFASAHEDLLFAIQRYRDASDVIGVRPDWSALVHRTLEGSGPGPAAVGPAGAAASAFLTPVKSKRRALESAADTPSVAASASKHHGIEETAMDPAGSDRRERSASAVSSSGTGRRLSGRARFSPSVQATKSKRTQHAGGSRAEKLHCTHCGSDDSKGRWYWTMNGMPHDTVCRGCYERHQRRIRTAAKKKQ